MSLEQYGSFLIHIIQLTAIVHFITVFQSGFQLRYLWISLLYTGSAGEFFFLILPYRHITFSNQKLLSYYSKIFESEAY